MYEELLLSFFECKEYLLTLIEPSVIEDAEAQGKDRES